MTTAATPSRLTPVRSCFANEVSASNLNAKNARTPTLLACAKAYRLDSSSLMRTADLVCPLSTGPMSEVPKNTLGYRQCSRMGGVWWPHCGGYGEVRG